jgi:hypothetical protein
MRNSELRAIFENWKLPNGVVLPGKFTIELVGKVRGRNYRYYPVLIPTRVEFRDHEGKPLGFAESKLEEGKETIRKMFETQVSEWQ